MAADRDNAANEAPAQGVLTRTLERLIPGTSPATRILREKIVDFCIDPTARTVFLKGPIGVGKSTMARVIGFLKRIALVRAEAAQMLVNDLRFVAPGLIDEKLMHWYIEVPLTGLVESLAEAQLFGTVKGAGTGVLDRAGVFELAQLGRKLGTDSSAIKLTGGVVFLDEIAELTAPLQSKLLPVLSGGVFHRVGGEVRDLTYRGITISASWKGLGVLRPDLVSRLTDRVIEIPTIAARGDDISILIDAVQDELIEAHRKMVADLSLEPTVAPYWRAQADRLQRLNEEVTGHLATVDWSLFGNLRGLSNAVRQLLFTHKGLRAVLNGLERIEPLQDSADESLLAELKRRGPDGSGLAGHVREIEVQRRAALRERLLNDHTIVSQLSRQLGIPQLNMEIQAKQLDRSRRRGTRTKEK